jgi:hypothetical protein
MGVLKLNFLSSDKRIHLKSKPRGIVGSFIVGHQVLSCTDLNSCLFTQLVLPSPFLPHHSLCPPS